MELTRQNPNFFSGISDSLGLMKEEEEEEEGRKRKKTAQISLFQRFLV